MSGRQGLQREEEGGGHGYKKATPCEGFLQ